MECISLVLSPFIWTQFHALFMEKFLPRTLTDRKKYEFIALEQDGMFVVADDRGQVPFLV